MKKFSAILWIISWLFVEGPLFAQLSPGKLAIQHSHLEGLSNCTKCHILGSKVSNDKCLDCHKELKARISINKGYHVSVEVKGKLCSSCHSDHHGTNFKMIRFETEKFNHDLTGYKLTGAHRKSKCIDCHKTDFISSKEIRSKKYTYLGLSTECLNCHLDYHQKTLNPDCSECHNNDAFKPASIFNHSRSNFKLLGKHAETECVKCHTITSKEGKKFQQFKGLKYETCINCHKDPHENKFGSDCAKCHSFESFRVVKSLNDFDHSKTRYKLEDKHLKVDCKACHKTNYTAKLKHDQCGDCHTDYHQNQFENGGIKPDCAKCHTTKGFQGSHFTIEMHNDSPFKLTGAHLATPCFECHKKQEKWSFRNIGSKCIDCHKDIHESHIDKKYYPESDCRVCHNNESWNMVTFEHDKTRFKLTGAHIRTNCRVCHFKPDESGNLIQSFSTLTGQCKNCHDDKHFRQFELDGVTDCSKCHGTSLWKIANFDHNRTAFKLDGKHSGVACSKCHKSVTNGQNIYVLYKIKKFKCEDCH